MECPGLEAGSPACRVGTDDMESVELGPSGNQVDQGWKEPWGAGSTYRLQAQRFRGGRENHPAHLGQRGSTVGNSTPGDTRGRATTSSLWRPGCCLVSYRAQASP